LQQHPAKTIKEKLESLHYLHQRLQAQHPQLRLLAHKQTLTRSHQRLTQALTKQINNAKQQQSSQAKNISFLSPVNDIKRAKQASQKRLLDLSSTMKAYVLSKEQHLGKTAALLDTVSPLATLSRGYSMTLSENILLRSVRDVQKNQIITSQLADGEIVSTVNSVSKTASPAS